MMSIKTVNALSHYTDWTIGHVHAGALGWVGLIIDGRALLPDPAPVRPARRCTACGSIDAALLDRDHRHRALHRRDVDRRRDAGPDVARGQCRRHADLHASSRASRRPIRSTSIRLVGGLLYLGGMLVMAWNTWMTVRGGQRRRRADRRAPSPHRLSSRTHERRRHHDARLHAREDRDQQLRC